MILPDVNLLIYAYDVESDYHGASSAWLLEKMENENVFLSWHTITGSLLIATNPRASFKSLFD